ncbi:MAG: site-specific integrase [Chitinophagaceae bacterium]|nr:site-specific integrase [Chitinophagaceae bacterium]
MAKSDIYLDKRFKTSNGGYIVKLRVTHDRRSKYYPTSHKSEAKEDNEIGDDLVLDRSFTENEFNRITLDKIKGKNVVRTTIEDNYRAAFNSFKEKADSCIRKLPVFSFNAFNEMYLKNRVAADSIDAGFTAYIDKLRKAKRIGTAVTFEGAIKSLNEYRKCQKLEILRFADITNDFLEDYTTWMTETNGKSITTVGIYLRSLRAVFNTAKIDKSLYPFGKGGFQIATGNNKKKALAIEEIAKFMNYDAPEGTTKKMARDYWVFLYLTNGINVKDFCLLKWKDVDKQSGTIKYLRSKTKNSKKKQELVEASIKNEFSEMFIKKYGVLSLDKDAFVFPHIKKGLTPERQREIYQQLTKTINKYMKQIAKELGINKPVTTYYARHSYATILMRSGVSAEFISKGLGHADLNTTKAYLAGFETEAIHKASEVLIPKRAINE